MGWVGRVGLEGSVVFFFGIVVVLGKWMGVEGKGKDGLSGSIPSGQGKEATPNTLRWLRLGFRLCFNL